MFAKTSRRDRLEELLSPAVRLIWGGSLLLLFLLQHDLLLKTLTVLLFAFLAIFSGKRLRWFYFIVLALSITVFNVLSPFGMVLFMIGPFPVTRGALLMGLEKGVTIVGLVFVSLFTVSRNIVVPGRFGAFLSRSLFFFERLYAEKKKVRRGHVVEDIDAILERVSEVESVQREAENETAPKTGLIGVAVATLVLLIVLGMAIVSRFVPWS